MALGATQSQSEPLKPTAHSKLSPCTLDALLIRSGFNDARERRVAWAVVMRESGARWWLVSNGADVGLFQINLPTHPGVTKQEMLNPVFNTRYARYLTIEQNWHPWGLNWNERTGAVTKDYRDYDWSVSRSDRLIWAPFRYWYRHYPRCSR